MSDISLSSSASGRGSTLKSARRSPVARVARVLAVILIIAGALTLIDAGVTLVWQEPISALYATLRQSHLSGELRKVEHAESTPTPVERLALASIADERRRIEYLARELQRHAPNGSPVGRIVIPKINASYVMIDGTGTEDLESGPGVYPETNFPGIPGTTAIAGHRTTYLAPFRHIDALSPGSQIELEMPYAHFTYTVTEQRVVAPTDVQAAIGQVGYTRLVLSACTPLFSAAKRLLVYARLTRTVPEGAARRLPGGLRTQPIEVPSGAADAARRALHVVLESLDPHFVTPLV